MWRDNAWKMVRELAEMIKNDSTDALDYADRDFSLDGISGEDSFEFVSQVMRYREWMSDFEDCFRDEHEEEDDDEYDNYIFVPSPGVIDREEFMNLPKNKVSFIVFSGEGAMGEAGKVILITDDYGTGTFNYLHGDITEEDFLRAFPAFRGRRTAEDGTVKPPRGWRLFDMGAGNCFAYRSRYEKKFGEMCSLYDSYEAICAHIYEIVYDILYGCE